MATAKNLDTLFLDELRDLYDAEKQLTKALPKLARNASSDELRSAIEEHLEQTRTHVERLEQVFDRLDEKPRGKHCAGIAGIIEEGNDLLGEEFEDAVKDAGIIAGAQRAEHYEIGAYGSILAWAKLLGKSDVIQILSETLKEEKAADRKLSELAEGGINEQAAAGAGHEHDEEEEEEGETEGGRLSASSGRGQKAGTPGLASRGNASSRSMSNGRGSGGGRR